jgi:hypothetical protein
VVQVNGAVRLRAPIPPMTEKRFQAKVAQLARFCRWRVYHTFDSRRSEPGWPDLFLVRDGIAIAAELKLDDEEPRDDQRDWLTDLDAVPGIHAVCWHPRDMDVIVRALA